MYSILDQINKLTKTNKLILAAFAFLAVLAFGGGRAHAATLTVNGGCTINDAIDSINSGSDQASCGGSSYGTSDKIVIPAGTHTLTADLFPIAEPVTVEGAGIGQTIIDGDGYKGFTAEGVTVTFSGMTIKAYDLYAILTTDCNVTVNNIEVDGTGSTNGYNNLLFDNTSATTKTVSANNIYMHDIYDDGSLMYLFSVHQRSGGTTTANLSNITLANSGNTVGSIDGFAIGIGARGPFGGFGTINATITNATINNISAGNLNAPYASFALSDGGDANVNVNIYNSTITGSRGTTGDVFPLVGVRSAAFYSASAGIGSGTTGNSVLTVGNSLFADNLSDSNSSNCATIDFTSGFSGAGTGNSSIVSEGHNMSDDATCSQFTQTGDQQNVNNIISTLGPLQNNGGVVPTRALLPGSPAAAAGGQVLGVTTDARGIARPSTCPSVGAYQFVGAVCGASTPATSGGGNAAAPSTGVGSVSSIFAVSVSLLGLSMITYASRKRLMIK